jgi:DmsE family decaheme c-type cytochrome
MSMTRPLIFGAVAVLVLLGPSAGVALAQGSEELASCADCHEDVVTAFAANPHARGSVKDVHVPNATCESCHGDGTAHIEGGGDADEIVKPVGRGGAETCLACHDKTTDADSRHAGAHANSETINCFSCHEIHDADPLAEALLVEDQLQLCSSCHQTQAAEMRMKPYTHRIGRGGMECTSCHNPHGRFGRENLRSTRTGELPCLDCHSDKRGPFVFSHGSKEIGDCMSCHQPHGSSNPFQLTRTNVRQLCLECHSPIGGGALGSQPPAFHNLTLPRYQNCTSCHTAVHGSNRSPQLLK